VVAAALAQYGAMMTDCAGTVLTREAERCFVADRDYLVRNWLFTATYPVSSCGACCSPSLPS
jgi:hypothetical protein